MGERPPFETFTKPWCRGSFVLGNACGACERCAWERTEMNKVMPEHQSVEIIEKIIALMQSLKASLSATSSRAKGEGQ